MELKELERKDFYKLGFYYLVGVIFGLIIGGLLF